MEKPSSSKTLTVLRKYFWILLVVWTVLVGSILLWGLFHQKHDTEQIALIQARNSFDKDLVYRRWAANHGGVYVPITEKTPPNPYLSHIEERDITTPSGRALTLVNPAYMTRRIHELGLEQYGLRGHITSLNPIRSANAADEWETKALRAFEQGVKEVSSVEKLDNQNYMRLMRPLITEQSCLKCHADQGYKVGDLRGGISIAVPMAPIQAVARGHALTLTMGHFVLWLLGMGGICLGGQHLKQRIQDRKQAEEELHESEELSRASLNATTDMVYLVKPDGKILAVNNIAAQNLGKTPDELIGTNSLDYFSPDVAKYRKEQSDKVVRSGKPLRFEDERDGRFFDISIYPTFDSEGKVDRLAVFVGDITERKRADDALKIQRYYLEKAQEIGVIGTWELDIAKNKLIWTDENYRIFGVPLGTELTYEIFLNCVHPDDREYVDKKWTAALNNEPYDIEHRIIVDGRVRWVREKAELQFDGKGNCIRGIGFTQDITERKQAEQLLAIKARITEIFLKIPDDEMYREVLQIILEAIESEYGVFGYIDENGDLVVPSMTSHIWEKCQVAEKKYVFARSEWGDSTWPQAICEKRTIYSNEPSSNIPKGHISISRHVSLPIIYREEVIGLIQVANRNTAYTEKDIQFLESIADTIAPVLGARLQTDRQNRARKQDLEKIENLAKFPSENPNPVLRMSKDGKLLYANSAGQSFLKGSKTGQIVPGKWRQTVSEVFSLNSAKRIEITHESKIFAFIVVPVVQAGYANLYGRDITEQKQAQQALQKAHDELEKRVRERTQELQKTVTDLQIEVTERIKAQERIFEDQKQLRKMASEMMLIEERERREIATALHDSIGQILAFSSMELGTFLKTAPEELSKPLTRVREMIEQAITETRTLTFDLSPTILYTFGLEAAIEQLAEQFSEEHGFQCVFTGYKGTLNISKEVQILLYRAVRELLVNIVKHAQAKTVNIKENRVDNSIEIIVEDDGEGFDLFSIDTIRGMSKGLGLFSIRERLTHLGGSLDILSDPGKGTKITLLAPLETE